jgi:ADP-heptose:LPS heptosyltransferase
MNVLLWKVGALGDVVMTTPLVRQLRAQLPHARIDYLVGGAFAPVLADNPHLDRVRTFDERILYDAHLGRVGEVLALLRGYDAVYVLDKHWVFTWLAWLARIPQRVGFRRRPAEGVPLTHVVRYGALRHEVDYYLDLLEVAGLRADRSDLAFEVPRGGAFEVPPGATVLINGGGVNPHENSLVRRMPDALFEALVGACAERGPVLFVGAAAETADYARFASPRCTNLCGRTTLAEAVSVLHQAEQVITTDTGLMHLAAAVNPRVTAVIGPTPPHRKCPPGARWVWGDEADYQSDYELFGCIPSGEFFHSLTVDAILRGTQPSPLSARQLGVRVHARPNLP